jgi:GH35 family endo-1,4-beta-xylanase
MPDLTHAYTSDTYGDPFKSPLSLSQAGIVAPTAMADRPFAVHARWYVEGFGFVWLEADNDGRLYTGDDLQGTRNLNVEFARTCVGRNAERLARYRQEGAVFSTEVVKLHDLAQALLEEALQQQGEDAARRADRALSYGLWAGEKIELEKARSDLARRPRTDPFFFGCETRQYVWAKSVDMTARFEELFNYATVTHYIYDTWYEVFEPREGEYRWGIKDNIVDWLLENDITIEGRPLFWFHSWVTPDWLKQKDFEALKAYVERHARNVVGHYGDKVLHWEVVNEYHDWANVHNHTPEQITEIVRLACEATHDTNPRVERLINNCCPFAEYAANGYMEHGEADRPLRSPRRFVQDLVEAEVPFEVVGVQMYFPQRSLADIVRLVERFAAFGKPVYITEVGATAGPTREDIMLGNMDVPAAPYDWHRPWDEALQADWMEQLYTILYSKPYIHNISWYDFADFRTFIPNGGLIRVDGERKKAFYRMKELLSSWNRLPGSEGP